MGRNAMPVLMVSSHHLSKEERERRELAEKKLQGDSTISLTPPTHLDTKAKKIYKEIISFMPEGVLGATDGYTVMIVADALSKMIQCQMILKEEGLLTEYTNKAGATNISEHKAIGIYQKYSQIFNTFGSKLGLSPADRAKLSLLNVAEEEDEVLKLLKS